METARKDLFVKVNGDWYVNMTPDEAKAFHKGARASARQAEKERSPLRRGKTLCLQIDPYALKKALEKH